MALLEQAHALLQLRDLRREAIQLGTRAGRVFRQIRHS
jgi:hypothetical protein